MEKKKKARCTFSVDLWSSWLKMEWFPRLMVKLVKSRLVSTLVVKLFKNRLISRFMVKLIKNRLVFEVEKTWSLALPFGASLWRHQADPG